MSAAALVGAPVGCLLRDRMLPELGFGRVVGQTAEGRVAVQFSEQAQARELYLAEHPELVRLRLQPEQPVEVGRSGEVSRGVIVEAPDFDASGLWSYRIRVGEDELSVDESGLSPCAPSSDDPHARLVGFRWDPPHWFSARKALLRALSGWQENSMGTPAFLGARIHPLPHQIHAARRVLCDRVPRFVLADEVGLGKTIEAGLIIQALQTANPELRVLVIAPGAMSRQWLCELFLRFGDQVYLHVDAQRLHTEPGKALVEAPRVIVSTTALESDPSFATLLLGARWDVVVIDEAHQIPPDHPLYTFLHRMARQVPALLALSATPSQRNEEGLLGLLGLVAPESYDPWDREGFRRRLEQHRNLATEPAASAPTFDEALDRRIIRTRRAAVQALGTLLCRRRLEVLAYRAGPGETALVQHVEALSASGDFDPPQLGLLGIYRRAACTAPLIFLELLQTRRKVLRRGTRRATAPLDLLAALGRDPGPAEAEFLQQRTVKEAAPLPEERAWLEEATRLTHQWLLEGPERCARFQAVSDWICRRGRGKVLVFAQDRAEVVAFADTLRETLGVDAVGALHHAVEEAQVSELALRFQQPGGLRVLVSDDLGGDGRNFQIANALVHLNQPWSVSRIEQRVGRLDRMGRDPKRDVLSLVVVGPSPTEATLLDLYRYVFQVYERSLGGLEFLLPHVQRQTMRAACEGAGALEQLRAPFARQVQEERTHQAETAAADVACSRRLLDDATEHAEILAATDGADDVQSVTAWAEVLGMHISEQGGQLYKWSWSWEHVRRAPAGLCPPDQVPTEGRVNRRGTFSRYRALGDESLELFAPGHPLVDALVRDVRSSTDGRATVFMAPLGADLRGQLYLNLLVRSELDADGAATSPGLRYRALARLWMQVRSIWVRLHPGSPEPAQVVPEPAIRKRLESSPAESHRPVDRDDLARWPDLPGLLAAVKAGVRAALDAHSERRAAEIRYATEQLRVDFQQDFDYLERQIRDGKGPAVEAAKEEIAARHAIISSVGEEGLVLEGLALVIAC